MAIQVLGGLSIDNLVSTDSAIQQRVEIQQRLFEQGFTDGIQIRVGHDYTNGAEIDTLLREANQLGIPFLVHGAAENLGVDFGQYFDECGVFGRYNKEYTLTNWKDFNNLALSNAVKAASSPHSLTDKVVIHPGYAGFLRYCLKDPGYSQCLEKVTEVLSNNVQHLLVETVPALVIDEKKGNISHYGYGATPEGMKELFRSILNKNQQVLIDFSHVEITANQMKKLPSLFSGVKSYESLLKSFLQMKVSRFTHFSGPTDKLQDDHDGFLYNESSSRQDKSIVANALQELERKFTPQDVYVALEINFNYLEKSKREIEQFRQKYIC